MKQKYIVRNRYDGRTRETFAVSPAQAVNSVRYREDGRLGSNSDWKAVPAEETERRSQWHM